MNLVKIFSTGNCDPWRDSRQDYGRREFRFPLRILVRFPARLWPTGISLPAENIGNIPGKSMVTRNFTSRRDPGEIMAAGIFITAENPIGTPSGNENPGSHNRARIPARSLPGFPPGFGQDPTKITVFLGILPK